MPIVATVTRTGGGVRFFSQSPSNFADQGGVGFSLRKAGGQALGMYQSVGAAQSAFNGFYGRNRIYRWERRDLPGAIEQWVCIGTPLDPKEVWQLKPAGNQVPNAKAVTSVVTWIEPDVVPGSVKLATSINTPTVVGEISTVNDISGTGYTFTAAHEDALGPLLRDNLWGQQRKIIGFDGNDDRLEGNDYANPVAPAVICAAASLNLPGSSGNLIRVAGEPWTLAAAAGEWELTVDGTPLTRPGAISQTSFDIVTIVARTTGTELRVNGESVGTIPDVIDQAVTGLNLGGGGGSFWNGMLAFFMVVTGTTAQSRILQTERYMRERYQ